MSLGLSVLIPTRDAHCNGYFPKLLETIEDQEYQSFEVIIVQGDSRQGRAINIAAALARAPIIATLDDDARLGHDRVFGNLVRAMESNEKIGIAGVANFAPKNANWVVRAVMTQIPRRGFSPPVGEITDSDMAEHACMAMRKSVFIRVGGEHELIPRGLDPYLRHQFRKAGYRVVVIPDTWIHHLPPPTLRANFKQFFRNGYLAAYCNRFYPEVVIDQSHEHGKSFQPRVSFLKRALRFLKRVLSAILTLRWMYLLRQLIYACAFTYGWFTIRDREQL